MDRTNNRLPLTKRLLSAENVEQDPEIQEASDSSQDSPFDTAGFLLNSARLAIDLADFSRFVPAPLSLSSPGNTSTSDGSATSFEGHELMSPDATSDFSQSRHDTPPTIANVPDLSELISKIQSSHNSLNHGYPTFPVTQSHGIHQDDQRNFPKFDANYNPMLRNNGEASHQVFEVREIDI